MNVAAVAVVIGVPHQIQGPFPEMAHRLCRLAVVTGQRPIDKVKPGDLLNALDFPASLKTAAIDAAQGGVVLHLEQAVIIIKSKAVVRMVHCKTLPRVLLMDYLVSVPLSNQFIIGVQITLIARDLMGHPKIGENFQTVQAFCVATLAPEIFLVPPAPNGRLAVHVAQCPVVVHEMIADS